MSGLGGSTGFGVPATGCRRLAASGCASEMPPRPAKPVFPDFRRRRLQAPTALPRSRPGDRSYTTLQAASPCPPPGKNADRNQATTSPHHPELEPASASPAEQYKHNRCAPPPITIEAGIHSAPASRGTPPHGQADLEAKPDATHRTPWPPPTGPSDRCRLKKAL